MTAQRADLYLKSQNEALTASFFFTTYLFIPYLGFTNSHSTIDQ